MSVGYDLHVASQTKYRMRSWLLTPEVPLNTRQGATCILEVRMPHLFRPQVLVQGAPMTSSTHVSAGGAQ